jgi:hypothetical protein
MTSISSSPTTRRSAIWMVVSKIASVAALFTVIVLSGLVLVSAEGYFDPDHVARIFVSPPTPAFGP